ncbi:phage minor head protein [Sporomusa sphaeroides DSM 2875]|uniref:phage head morphogenesis protein n=1 Tax=Sporomusa sphaeroides TaxID=47679 RepID=UPI00202EF60C|nr:phage minor head protein [Sporomusa sphaeroides]MCM0757357.1 phage minor head protein [Sporomusa sphaeroides DSM 2875]
MADVIKLEPLSFDEAIEFFKTKVALTPKQFAKLEEAVRARAFTVGGITALNVLKDILAELTKALEAGTTIVEFRKNINDKLAAKGWDGLTPYRADNIFRTQIQTAYQVGRWKQITDPDVVQYRPYLIYDAVNDKRTRLAHLAMDGVTRRWDDPFWNTFYPPNGFRCRCSVRTASERDIKREGIKVETGAVPSIREVPNGPAIPVNPDIGFDRNAAKDAWQPDLSKYPDKLRQAFEKRQKGKNAV